MANQLAPTVPLIHGAQLPQIGLGTWPMDDAETEAVVAEALQIGYRLIDSAENYNNERGVGRAIVASGVRREEVFVTSKFNRRWHGVELAGQAYDQAIDRMGLDYLDLLLIHWPNPAHDRYVDAWQGLARLLEEGKVRAIGTSNFKPPHLERLLIETGVVPDVNQMQISPYLVRQEFRDYDEKHGILTQAWSPLGREDRNLLGEPLITSLAERYDRTSAQIILRWHVELGLIPIPKSSNPDRLRANLDIFDFSLTPEEVAGISALDQGDARPGILDSDVFGH